MRVAVAASVLVLLSSVTVVAAVVALPLPDAGAGKGEPTHVYFSDGVTPLGTFHHLDGEALPLDRISQAARDAVVAGIDPGFLERSVGVGAIVRATADAARGRDVSLGDRLTERHLAQLSEPADSRWDALRQIAVTVKAGLTRPREGILEDYLNTAYFGRGTYGIQGAASAYFGTTALQLTVEEAALLAGILPAPDAWDPEFQPERARERWSAVLNEMESAGTLGQGAAATAAFPEVRPYQREDGFTEDRGFLMDMVRAELAAVGITDLEHSGLTVVATLDSSLQRAAADAVASLPTDMSPDTRAVLVSIDPATGGVRALHTGRDYRVSPRNGAVLDRAQGGSTFKSFALIAALEAGMSLDHQFASTTPLDVNGYVVTNVDGRDRGMISLRDATAHSVNTVYAQVNAVVGPERTRDVAVRVGLPEDTAGLVVDPANVFGTASPHPVDMATVFATYAAGGLRHERHVVAEVRDGAGEILHRGGNEGTRVVKPEVIAQATEAMSGVVGYGTGTAARLADRPAAGKTGTSDANLSAWFCGFVPQLATVVAMYEVGEDGREHTITPFGGIDPVMGGSYPAILWHRFMSVATAGMPVAPLVGMP